MCAKSLGWSIPVRSTIDREVTFGPANLNPEGRISLGDRVTMVEHCNPGKEPVLGGGGSGYRFSTGW